MTLKSNKQENYPLFLKDKSRDNIFIGEYEIRNQIIHFNEDQKRC